MSSSLLPWLRLARPHQWVKNLFIIMPAPFAVAAGADPNWLLFAVGLLGFCVLSSGVYCFNDILDAQRDRLHPRKRERPVAAGQVSRRGAWLLSLALLLGGGALIFSSGGRSALSLSFLYVGLNLVYSLGARNLALVDVFLLSSGFLIRVLFGCLLLAVPPSNWLLLCSSTLALLLSLSKRHADLYAGLQIEHRPSLAGYTMEFLNLAMGITAAMALFSYALYCKDAGVFREGREFATLPFVAFGILNYLRLVKTQLSGRSPEEVIYGSPSLAFCGVGWVMATYWSLNL
ncbi:MAG: UbiA prenyltransferase family protein [Planctomycetota bacterium]